MEKIRGHPKVAPAAGEALAMVTSKRWAGGQGHGATRPWGTLLGPDHRALTTGCLSSNKLCTSCKTVLVRKVVTPGFQKPTVWSVDFMTSSAGSRVVREESGGGEGVLKETQLPHCS